MFKKFFVMSALVVSAVSFSACDEVGYTCQGAGTCEEPRACCKADAFGADCYWKADGTRFTTVNELEAYCYNSTDNPDCSGSGTCASPQFCCSGGDCYYEADGASFNCNGYDCAAAATDLADYCG